jgi:NADP-dependent 3-hydroxy acid dehydrogenase YdfG
MPTVAITGAAGAIGSVTATTFSEAGWDLALIDYGPENHEALTEAHPGALTFNCNLLNEEATREAFTAIRDEAGGLDAVLAIAGGFSMQAAHEATMADYNRMFNVNVQTLFNTARAALPALTAQDHSFFCGVSAPAAENGQASAALYAASKGAVAAYCKSLADEYQDDGVRVSVLYPMGVVDTPANRDAMRDQDPKTWIAPRELAEGMLHCATRSPRGHIPELKVHAIVDGA